jgi:SAM-dependent methyltransferase
VPIAAEIGLRCPIVIRSDFLQATRASYDAVADGYAEQFREELASKPLDRALLGWFAELTQAAGPVADVGCGPGSVTAHLNALGVTAFGIDLSPEMVAVARRLHPALRFEVGSMLTLDLPEGGLGGITAWYSIIHVPDERLPEAFAEFRRVLAPGGHVLLAFQVGDEPVHRTEGLGHALSLVFHRRRPNHVAELMTRAGLSMRATILREPEDYRGGVEKTQQAYLLARKPA